MDSGCLNSKQERVQTLQKYINDIHQQLVDYEGSLTIEYSDDDDDNNSENNIPKIMNILDEVADINEAAQILRPINLQLENLQSGLKDSLKSLQQTIDLLKLERDIIILAERNEGISSEED